MSPHEALLVLLGELRAQIAALAAENNDLRAQVAAALNVERD